MCLNISKTIKGRVKFNFETVRQRCHSDRKANWIRVNSDEVTFGC